MSLHTCITPWKVVRSISSEPIGLFTGAGHKALASARTRAAPARAHLSLCYLDTAPPEATWELLRAWARSIEVGETASIAYEAEVVAFGDGVERRLGRFPFRP